MLPSSQSCSDLAVEAFQTHPSRHGDSLSLVFWKAEPFALLQGLKNLRCSGPHRSGVGGDIASLPLPVRPRKCALHSPGESERRSGAPPALQRRDDAADLRAGNSGERAARRRTDGRPHVSQECEVNGGNISRTSDALGIERSHLYRKLKSLKINLERN